VHWLERFQKAAREAENKEQEIQRTAKRRSFDDEPQLYQGQLGGSDEHERTGLLPSAQQQQQQQQRDSQRALAARQAQIDLNQALIEEREMGIREIHQGVMEIDEIMTDLDIITREQGNLIYTIEDQIESSAQAVHEGVEKLEDAHQTQKNTRCSRCAIVVSLVCLAAIVITGIALGVKFG
jgi:t-SNARE complex subunit (syntaxin)